MKSALRVPRLAGWIFLLTLAAVPPVLLAQPESEAAHHTGGAAGEDEESGHLEIWKWVNFLLLAGALGYLGAKNLGPFFVNRSIQIRKGMIDAEEARAKADARVSAVEARLANLSAEIEALRRDAQAEAAAETERLRQETAAELAKMEERARQEIASLGKSARLELKRYSAGLAIQLAAQKLQSRISPESQEMLVRNFIRDLDVPAQPHS